MDPRGDLLHALQRHLFHRLAIEGVDTEEEARLVVRVEPDAEGEDEPSAERVEVAHELHVLRLGRQRRGVAGAIEVERTRQGPEHELLDALGDVITQVGQRAPR